MSTMSFASVRSAVADPIRPRHVVRKTISSKDDARNMNQSFDLSSSVVVGEAGSLSKTPSPSGGGALKKRILRRHGSLQDRGYLAEGSLAAPTTVGGGGANGVNSVLAAASALTALCGIPPVSPGSNSSSVGSVPTQEKKRKWAPRSGDDLPKGEKEEKMQLSIASTTRPSKATSLHKVALENQAEKSRKVVASPKAAVKKRSAVKTVPAKAAAKKRSSVKTFPEKLMEILDSDGLAHAISWSPNGMSFVVPCPKRFTLEVLPLFFQRSEFSSFTRKLYYWGFRKIGKGDDSNAFQHDLFRRDKPELCKEMKAGREKTSKNAATKEQVSKQQVIKSPAASPQAASAMASSLVASSKATNPPLLQQSAASLKEQPQRGVEAALARKRVMDQQQRQEIMAAAALQGQQRRAEAVAIEIAERRARYEQMAYEREQELAITRRVAMEAELKLRATEYAKVLDLESRLQREQEMQRELRIRQAAALLARSERGGGTSLPPFGSGTFHSCRF